MADLAERIAAEIENLEILFSKFPSNINDREYSVLEIAGIATLLHNFYNGVENILKQAARQLEVNLPTGPTWHRDLLEKAVELKVISESTLKDLRRYLAFRNFFVHGYAFELQYAKLKPLLQDANRTYQHFREDINIFLKQIRDVF